MTNIQYVCNKNCTICNKTGSIIAIDDGWLVFSYFGSEYFILTRKSYKSITTYHLCEECKTQDNIDRVNSILEKLKKEDIIKEVIE